MQDACSYFFASQTKHVGIAHPLLLVALSVPKTERARSFSDGERARMSRFIQFVSMRPREQRPQGEARNGSDRVVVVSR